MVGRLVILALLALPVFAGPPRLRVSDNGRCLVAESGEPVFLLADTGWSLVRRAKREDVDFYLRTRKSQGFNAVAFVGVGSNPDISNSPADAYGRAAFEMTKGRPDPTKPVVAPGNSFWEHVDYCIDRCAAEGMYAVFLPTWGSWVVGSYNGKDTREVVFDEANARVFGRFVGGRYRDRANVIWMLGGDRAAVDGGRDCRPVFRALAAGIREGAGPDCLISYHPRKGAPQSSEWFQGDGWLSFNSIQEWPESQVGWVTKDWSLSPAKPTWLFEGRYENYFKGNYRPEQWGAWQCRQQAYQTAFAGAFGHTYGNERVFGFEEDPKIKPGEKNQPPPGSWRDHLNDRGALCMRHLVKLMGTLSREQCLARVPAQDMIDGAEGKAERLKSDRVTVTRGSAGDYAFAYVANGRAFRLKVDRLAGPTADASWFDPRTGEFVEGRELLPAGGGAEACAFTPPGGARDGNDWVLVLRR